MNKNCLNNLVDNHLGKMMLITLILVILLTLYTNNESKALKYKGTKHMNTKEIIPDNELLSLWKCEDCGNKVQVGPTFFQDSGTPLCDCGQDMEYINTTRTTEHNISKKLVKIALNCLLNDLKMLNEPNWEPSKLSPQDSINNVEMVIEYFEENK